jgi:hypothetical protein
MYYVKPHPPMSAPFMTFRIITAIFYSDFTKISDDSRSGNRGHYFRPMAESSKDFLSSHLLMAFAWPIIEPDGIQADFPR